MPIFTAENNHTKTDEAPTSVTNSDPNVYVGYFQNEHGAQWVFTFDRSRGIGDLRGGDASWRRLPVIAASDGVRVQVNLNAAEAMWLEACWKAATESGK
jgi:hypothetical protein